MSSETKAKKPYEKPRLREYGDLRSRTEASNRQGMFDGSGAGKFMLKTTG